MTCQLLYVIRLFIARIMPNMRLGPDAKNDKQLRINTKTCGRWRSFQQCDHVTEVDYKGCNWSVLSTVSAL